MIVTGPSRSSSTDVHGEVPAGAIDGVNAVFSTAYPFKPQSERVYLNGVRQRRDGDYSVVTNTSLEFIYPPRAGDALLVDYLR